MLSIRNLFMVSLLVSGEARKNSSWQSSPHQSPSELSPKELRWRKQQETPSSSIRSHRNRPLLSQQQIFERLLCFSSGWVNARSLRTVGSTVSMCTGGTIRAVMYATEGRWREVQLPAIVVTCYSLGCMLARHLQQQAESHWRDHRSTSVSMISNMTEPHTSMPILGFHVSFLFECKRSMLAVATVPAILGLFVLADFVKPAPLLCVGAQASAYGLMHTAAQRLCGGTVLFAVTGHYSAACKAAVERVHGRNDAGRVLLERGSMLGSFALGVFAAVLFWDRVVPLLSFHLEYEHSCSGLWFAALFLWFSRTLRT